MIQSSSDCLSVSRLLAVRFSLYMGQEQQELRARRDWDETRVCHTDVEKQTADSSVYFRDNNSQNNLIKV